MGTVWEYAGITEDNYRLLMNKTATHYKCVFCNNRRSSGSTMCEEHDKSFRLWDNLSRHKPVVYPKVYSLAIKLANGMIGVPYTTIQVDAFYDILMEAHIKLE